MKRYYYDSYRGFANEFTIISVDQSNPAEVKAFSDYWGKYMRSSNINWDLHSITAKRAKEIIASEKRQARAYLRAGLNLTENPVGATEITSATEFFNLYL